MDPAELAKINRYMQRLEHTSFKAAHDHRAHHRMAVREGMTAIILSDPVVPSWEVHGRNISPQGVAFTSERKFAVNEVFALDINLANVAPRLALCVAKHCHQEKSGRYLTGAAILETIANPTKPPSIPVAWLERAASGQ